MGFNVDLDCLPSFDELGFMSFALFRSVEKSCTQLGELTRLVVATLFVVVVTISALV
jgi:hypothetical protein